MHKSSLIFTFIVACGSAHDHQQSTRTVLLLTTSGRQNKFHEWQAIRSDHGHTVEEVQTLNFRARRFSITIQRLWFNFTTLQFDQFE